jgi:CheY-like chemotaxis protein
MNARLHAPHVLLVDDSPDVRDLLCDVLEEEGYRVTSKASIQDVDTVRELAPDLIVHDLLFAEHRPAGWAFLHTLRQDPNVGQVPVILCTADGRIHTDQSWIQQARYLKLRVMTKPFDLMDFLALLETVLPHQGGAAPRFHST